MSRSHGAVCALAVMMTLGAVRQSVAEPGDLLGYVPFPAVSPQDIARDEAGTFWVTTFLDSKLYHIDASLKGTIEVFPAPAAGMYLTGVAFDSIDGTIFVADAVGGRVVEVDRATGLSTGRSLTPPFAAIRGYIGSPTLRGLTFDPNGDGGRGSLYVVDSGTCLLLEMDLGGALIRYFAHPDDPDGFPGEGLSPTCTDADLVLSSDGRSVDGFYMTGGRDSTSRVLRVNADGAYSGSAVSILDSGGVVSGLLRTRVPHPNTGEMVDAFVAVVESNPRMALLEGGEPELRDLFDVRCESRGQEVEVDWASSMDYDLIEVVRGCEVLDTLPGSATRWTRAFAEEDAILLRLRAIKGGRTTETAECLVVTGIGRVAERARIEGAFPVDLARTQDGTILVVDTSDRQVLLFDDNLDRLGEIAWNDAVALDGELVTGLAYSDSLREIFLFNAETWTVAVLDELGAFVRSFTAKLPNLEDDPDAEPDYGFVYGMAFDPSGNGGRGSLWVTETIADQVFELSLDGDVLRSWPHPLIALEPPPADVPYGISSGPIARSPVPGSEELYLAGGTLYEQRPERIFRVKKDTGAIVPGSIITTRGIRDAARTSSFEVESLLSGGKSELVVVTLDGRNARLLRVDASPEGPAEPAFFSARQVGLRDDVLLELWPQAEGAAIEIFRDCELLATLPPGDRQLIDRSVPPGAHVYAARAVLKGASSGRVEASLRVGAGAMLERHFLWPCRSPKQLTEDPADGSLLVVGDYPGEERNVYRYSSQLEFLEAREARLDPEWEIATLAVRNGAQGSEVYYILWQLPVPLDNVGGQTYLLAKEGTDKVIISQTPITPPRPTNGFVTYPTGLAWNPTSDTFYYLERNSKTFVEMTLEGATLRTFPHPSPPFQNFVFNLGVDYVATRGTLWILGADRYDLRVSKVLEMTPTGSLTGFEIPLAGVPATITGVTFQRNTLIAVGPGLFPEMYRIKALPDEDILFLRGDADGNLSVNLTDVIYTLDHLFRGGPKLPCPDAADADDNGAVNLTDAIATLRTLFQGGGPLPAPYPEPGADPTRDDLECF